MSLVDGHGVRRWAAEFVAGSRRVTGNSAAEAAEGAGEGASEPAVATRTECAV